MSNPAASPLVPHLNAVIDSVLGPLLPPGSRCALLGFPDHGNVGDSMIWLGEQRWLAAHGVGVVHASSAFGYSPHLIRSLDRDVIVLLHGGGNLGDVWPQEQAFRERVLAGLPDRRVIQFPQTLHFESPARLRAAQVAFDAHPDLTLLCRDDRSLALAQASFRATSLLCPDLAFALDLVPTLAPREAPTLRLLRTDLESSLTLDSRIATHVDWSAETVSPLALLQKLLEVYVRKSPRPPRYAIARLDSILDTLVTRRTQRGIDLFANARGVITDRLHGHILALLLGLPNVLLDNSYGKNRAFFDTWTATDPSSRFAATLEEAEAMLADLQQSPNG